MSHNLNHTAMNNDNWTLNMLAGCFGVFGGSMTYISISPASILGFSVSLAMATVMGAAGWAGGYIAKWAVKHIKIKWKNFKNK